MQLKRGQQKVLISERNKVMTHRARGSKQKKRASTQNPHTLQNKLVLETNEQQKLLFN